MLPEDTAPNLDFALAYHALSWWVFPGRSPLDLAQLRQSLLRQGRTAEDAAAETERRRKSTFVNWRERRAQGEAGRPTEAEIRGWFEHDPLRPVIVLTGTTATGEELIGIDVDPLRGGNPDPWTGEHVTLLAETPRGGVHAFHIDSAPLASSEGKDDGPRLYGLADGVDVRATGGLLVMPSGDEATPGRRWIRRGLPSPLPLNVRPILAERAASRLFLPSTNSDTATAADRPFATACHEPAPKGTRNPRAKALIGMLARTGPLPGDAVVAAIDLLTADAERRLAPDAATLDELADGWCAQLYASARTQAFALKVLRAWNSTRGAPPWPADKLEAAAASLWYSAHSREQVRLASRVVPIDDEDSPEPDSTPDPEQPPAPDPEDSLAPPPEDHEDPAHDQTDDAPRGGIFSPPIDDDDQALTPEQEDAAIEEALNRLAPTIADDFTLEDFDAVQDREMLQSGVLPPWRTVLDDGSVITADDSPHGHGFGELIDDILGGGLKRGFMVAVGAEGAKCGKTALMDQWMDGILLQSAEVLKALARGEKTDAPIIVRYDLSEMSAEDLTSRQLGRWLGIDSTVFRRGRKRAHKAPGIQHIARNTGERPESIAARYLAAARAEQKTGDLAMIRRLRRVIHDREIVGKHDEQTDTSGRTKALSQREDHRRGVLLLRQLAELVKADVALRAKQWGVPESQVYPLIFIDPIQRFQAVGLDSVGALDELIEETRAIADDLGAIVFFTSDTNKATATSSAPQGKNTPPKTNAQLAAGAFRGSYKVLHLPEVALVLRAREGVWPRQVELIVGVTRWNDGVESLTLDYSPQSGRYIRAMPRAPSPAPRNPLPPIDPHDDEDLPPRPAAAPAFAPRTGPAHAADGLDIRATLAVNLTPAEVEVALMVGRGLSNIEIAVARHTSESSISQHLKRCREKLGVASRAALVEHVRALAGDVAF